MAKGEPVDDHRTGRRRPADEGPPRAAARGWVIDPQGMAGSRTIRAWVRWQRSPDGEPGAAVAEWRAGEIGAARAEWAAGEIAAAGAEWGAGEIGAAGAEWAATQIAARARYGSEESGP